MRLYEIIDTDIISRKLTTDFDISKLQNDYDTDELNRGDKPNANGIGLYSKVNIDPDDPFTAKNKYRLPINNMLHDAYSTYIYYIGKQGLAKSNPFFPRVYNMEMVYDKAGYMIPEFDIEPLIPILDGSFEGVYALGATLLSNFEGIMSSEYQNVTSAATVIAKILKQTLLRGIFIHINNTKLVQALQAIIKVKNTNNEFRYDLNLGNIMLRPTPAGYQLVITDPLAN